MSKASPVYPANGTITQRIPIGSVMDGRISALLRSMSVQLSMEQTSVNSLAASVNLSPSRLRSVFRTQVGVPLSRYIKQQQLQRARLLLQNSFLSVKQVRAQVGLDDHSHFARDYKRLFGESPSCTRSSSLNAHMERVTHPRKVVPAALLQKGHA